MSSQQYSTFPKRKKRGCGIFLFIVLALVLYFGVRYLTTISERTAYMTCKLEAMELNPYYNSYDSFSKSTISRDENTFIVTFSEYTDNAAHTEIIESVFRCQVIYQNDNFDVINLEKIETHFLR